MKTHKTSIRVRYQETDNMGVVYYSNYFVWFEIARTEFLRCLGHSYRRMETQGTYLMVVDAQCAYKNPARYDDLITVYAWISSIKNCSLVFEYKICLEDRTIATGKTGHVFVDRKGVPIKIPQPLKNALTTSN